MPQRFAEPVVQRAVVLELQRADRVRDALDRVALAVRVVVRWVDAPLVAGAVVRRVLDAVHHRVAQVDVGRRHVDLRPQRAGAVGELALLHPLEQVEILRRPMRSRYGLFLPGSLSVPRCSRTSSAVRSQTYALPSLMSWIAQS